MPERPAGRDSGAVAAHGADGPFADDAAAGRRFGAGVMRTCEDRKNVIIIIRI